MDLEGNSAEVFGWLLHSNAACHAEYQLEWARNQIATVWWAATVEWQGCIQKDAICRSLSSTPRAPSRQTCAMGAITCTWAPIERSPHGIIRGGSGAGCRGGELCRACQMYGRKRRLENTLANLSEDDLMNEWNGAKMDPLLQMSVWPHSYFCVFAQITWSIGCIIEFGFSHYSFFTTKNAAWHRWAPCWCLRMVPNVFLAIQTSFCVSSQITV